MSTTRDPDPSSGPDSKGGEAAPPEIAVRFEDSRGYLAALLTVLGEARRAVCIYTRDLEPLILDRQPVLDELRKTAIKGRASIRILVQDLAPAIHSGHRIIETSRRMSSSYAIRKVDGEDCQYPSAFVTTDAGAWLLRSFGDLYEGEGNRYDPPKARQLNRYFDEVWERASVPVEFRALGI